jgi:tRNA (guanine-N7-)-methyltransferase
MRPSSFWVILKDSSSFFGRRKGKPLRAHQDELVRDLLPMLRVSGADVAAGAAFAPDLTGERWLEIGFGGGEHLARMAELHPKDRFIGCEVFLNGVAKLLAAVESRQLTNIRLFDEDAARLLADLPGACIDRICILYPDPWPKFRQRKRRFISPENIEKLARVLRPGGELRFATDIDDYAGWALSLMIKSGLFDWRGASPDDWSHPWPDWASTRYEIKARAAGRATSYLTFIRRS